MDLSRSPSLDSEQQFALEQQRELQKAEQTMQQQPELTKQLDKQLGNNAQLNAELGKYSAEQQQEIKHSLSSAILSKSGPNLPQVDRVGLTKDGGVYIRFDEFKQVTVNPEQVVGKPLLAQETQHSRPVTPASTPIARAHELEQNRVRYLPMSESYEMKQVAYLPAEGVGINGSFFNKGHVGVDESGTLHVSGMGRTAASHSGQVTHQMSATILVNGKEVATQPLKMPSEPGFWPNDGYSPIGTAKFSLPQLKEGDQASIRLDASYIYNSGHGHAVPMTSPKFWDKSAVMSTHTINLKTQVDQENSK